MTREEAIATFDPNQPGVPGCLFGLPFTPENARLVLIPVPWEVTVSYRSGTARGPEAILKASAQVDLYQHDIPKAWQYGIAMLPLPRSIRILSETLRIEAADYIEALSEGELTEDSPDAKALLQRVDEGCRQMVTWVQNTAAALHAQDKQVALIGGDHSTPLGLISHLATLHSDFGILQIDAHADLRLAFEGFTYSHASIMTNVLHLPQVCKLVQVGIRDYCDEEAETIAKHSPRIATYFYPDLARSRFAGAHWHDLCRDIIAQLPQKVYISFDIDGLDPKLCPNTGTPVPGGFEYEEVNHLLTTLAASGREIIGFDLNEVSPGPEPDALNTNDWDGNVGARLLYRLCNLMAVSRRELTLRG